jgi:hypothetical protein
MIAEQKRSLIMLVLLGASIFIYHLGRGILDARGLEPAPGLEFLYTAIFICGVVWWLRAEIQSSPITGLYCTGLFAYAAWPIIIPYHLLKTRGARGLLPLFALIGTFIFARILATVIYLAVFGFPTG